jgi:hypothetical protein
VSSDIAVGTPVPTPYNGQQSLMELGARLGRTGFTEDQARGLAAEIQEIGVTVALGAISPLLERLRRITMGRFGDLAGRVAQLPSFGGYIRRDSVIMLIEQAASTNPNTR